MTFISLNFVKVSVFVDIVIVKFKLTLNKLMMIIIIIIIIITTILIIIRREFILTLAVANERLS